MRKITLNGTTFAISLNGGALLAYEDAFKSDLIVDINMVMNGIKAGSTYAKILYAMVFANHPMIGTYKQFISSFEKLDFITDDSIGDEVMAEIMHSMNIQIESEAEDDKKDSGENKKKA